MVTMIVDAHAHIYPPDLAKVILGRFASGFNGSMPGRPSDPQPGTDRADAGNLDTRHDDDGHDCHRDHVDGDDAVNGESVAGEDSPGKSLPAMKLAGPVTLDEAMVSMDKVGVERSWILPVAGTPKWVRATNDWVLDTARRDDRFTPFVSLHARDPLWREELERTVAAGARGVKMHVALQLKEGSDFLVSEQMSEIFQAIEKADIPVVCCTFFPDEVGSGIPGASLRLLDVLRQFPRLRLVAAHMGAMFNWGAGNEPILGSRAYLDLAYVPGMVDPKVLVSWIRAHGAERILFGTDTPYANPQRMLDAFCDLPLDDDEKAAILGRNAAAMMGELR